jgi:hypothetical protein
MQKMMEVPHARHAPGVAIDVSAFESVTAAVVPSYSPFPVNPPCTQRPRAARQASTARRHGSIRRARPPYSRCRARLRPRGASGSTAPAPALSPAANQYHIQEGRSRGNRRRIYGAIIPGRRTNGGVRCSYACIRAYSVKREGPERDGTMTGRFQSRRTKRNPGH